MMSVLAGFQRLPRVAVYAMLAALATSALFAADGAYRWYRDASTPEAIAFAPDQSVQAPKPAVIDTQQTGTPSQMPWQIMSRAPEPDVAANTSANEKTNDRFAADPVPSLASSASPDQAGDDLAAPMAPAAVAEEAAAPVASQPVPRQIAPRQIRPQQAQRKRAPRLRRQEARRSPEKQAARTNAATRPQAAKAKPAARTESANVYWERDTQLGYAPQLRKRTCNPATGQMPMQCYYPREGRERFPAKPLN